MTRIVNFTGDYVRRLDPRRGLRQLGLVAVTVLVLGGASYYYFVKLTGAASDAVTLTSQADWEAGEFWNSQLDTTTTAGDLKIAAGGVGSWDTSTPGFPENPRGFFSLASETATYGADLATDGTYVYMIIGGRQPGLFRYNPDTNTWKTLAEAKTAFNYNGSLTFYDGHLYAINGHDGLTTTDTSGELWDYDIAQDSWTRLADAPDVWGTVSGPGGSDIKSGNNGKLYALQANAQTGFWEYTIATNAWRDLAPVPDPVSASNSHPMVYSDVSFDVSGTTHCEAGCMYVFQGGGRLFSRYDISFNQWYTAFADVPAGLGSVTTGSAITLDTANDELYAFRGGNTEFMKYTIGNPGTWDALTDDTANPERLATAGASLVYLDGYVYATVGAIPQFGRYDIGNSRWDMAMTQVATSTTGDNLIAYVPNGADCADASGCLFIAQANATAPIRRYDISARTWSAGANNVIAGAGASMCYDGAGNLFVARGANQVTVYNHTISTGVVTTINAPAAVQQGGSITCTDDNRFYLLHGVAGVLFSYYNGTSIVAENAINTNGLPYIAASYGAALSSNFKLGSPNTAATDVYALIGNGRGVLLNYNIAGDVWTELANLPSGIPAAALAYTTVMGFDNTDNLYVIVGKFQKEFWRYDISENTWSRAADLPVRMARSMGISNGNATGQMYVMRGENWNGIHVFNSEADDYIPSATWISAPIDLDFVSAWEQLTATHPTAVGSSITIDLRSSDDQVGWSDWETVVNASTADSSSIDISAITTPENQYVQYRVTLTSDNSNTPVLSDVTITYTKDSTPPSNPTATAYTDSTKATALTDEGSYFYTTPYFELDSADEAESPIDGYYVAWSSSSSFDPTVDEEYFQTGTTFTVNKEMTRAGAGTIWYLRVAAKDEAGNTATPESVFQYTYTGIAEATEKTWTSQSDFEAGDLSDVTASVGGDLTLSPVINGAWTTEAALPLTVSNGASVTYMDGKLYILRGTNTNTFWSYDVKTKVYTTLAVYGGGTVGAGSSVISVAPNGSTCTDSIGCLFVSRGNGQRDFQRYNIGGGTYGANVCGGAGTVSANTWTACSSIPIGTTFSNGGSLSFDGAGTIYSMLGNSINFYKYSLATDTWTQLPNLDNVVSLGGTLVYSPNGTGCTDVGGCLYATRGGAAANNTHFWRFKINANTWEYLLGTPIWFGDGASARRINNLIYYTRGGTSTPSVGFYTYNLITGDWSRLADTPTNIYQGSEQGLAYDPTTNFLYTLRGYTETSVFAYDITNDTWDRTPSIPNFYTNAGFAGGAVGFDTASSTMFIARGNGHSDFWAMNTTTNTWTQLPDVPHVVSTGADARFIDHANDAYDGLYLMVGTEAQGDNIGYFYRYNPSTKTWTRLANRTTEPAAGADLVYDGDDTLYTAQGGTTTFYRYIISTNTWSTVASTIPVANGSGSCAVNINVGGTDYIYLTRANSQANVYRFNVGTETWDAAATVENAPGILVGGDTCVEDGQGNILIPQGTTNTNMYVLDPDGDGNGVWTTRTVPQVYSNGALVQVSSTAIRGFRGGSTSAMDRYVVATGSTGFQQNGSWTSEIIDFSSGLYSFGGFDVTMSDAANTTVILQTRTCSDIGCAADANHASWEEWTDATNKLPLNGVGSYTVASPVARYGQARLLISSNQVLTPTVNSAVWRYYTDSTDPENPSAPINAYTDSSKVTSISHDTWNDDLTPYFEWTASDDTNGIGLDGFYVYFGTDSSKDPVDDDNDPTNLAYKTGTNYYAATSAGVGSWNAATQSASSLTNNTYYLRIKTKDRNNNLTDVAVAAFTFKVDDSNPADPSGLGVSPSGYTNVNSFNFSWTASTDDGPAGVSHYCYKAGPAGAETCQASSSTSVTGILAYQTRVNTFYVRARDTAMNYSNYTTTSYYYAGDAPTAPTGLTVTPDSQVDDNSFQINWSLPDTCLGQTPCVADDILRYCYTINEVPDASTCGTNYGGSSTPSPDGGWTTPTQTSTRLLPTFSAATQQDTNTIYLVAMDAIGNIDFDNVVSETYDFTSNAPGAPAGLQAVDSSDRAANRYSITLTWDEPDDVGAGVVEYKVYRCIVDGTDCDAPDPTDDPPANYTNIASVNTLGYLDTSLSNTTTYAYFGRAIGPGNSSSGNSAVVTMKPEGKFKNAPVMSGQPSVQARIRSATIQWLTLDDTNTEGDLIAHPASSFAEYGTTTAYGGETGTSELVNEHEVVLTGLEPDTTYHYKVKWTDVDGNEGESADFTFETLGAPSAPVNLEVTPATNTSNSFTFSWDAPADEGITVSGYFFVVNTTPTADNVQFTTDTTFGPYAAATQQGRNTFYVVAVDDSGNVNYSSYASVDFEAYTPPPSPPANLTIVDSSNRDAQRYNITLTWDPPTTTASGEQLRAAENEEIDLTYTVYRSLDDGATFEDIAQISSTGYLDTGLSSSQNYTYKITAADSAGASSDSTTPVSEIPEGRFTQPPAITQAPVAAPDSFSAVVNWQTERVASSFVEFGTEAGALSKEQGTADLVAEHSVRITGLKAETQYFFRIKSIDIDENVAYSETSSFTTLEAPSVSDVKISDVRLRDAVLTWKTNKESTAVINYGTTANYGLTYNDTSGSYSLVHTVKLENLSDGSLYHLRIGGEDRNGNPITSDDYTFTTLTFPQVTNVAARNQSAGQTEITWTTNVPTTSSVEYYGDTIPPKTQGNTALVTEHSILLYGLEDATKYLFKARGADQFGYEAISAENEFTTLEDTTPPEVYGVKSESNTIGSGETSKIQIIISWKTNEPTTSQVDYGVGLSGSDFTDQTEENAELVMDHLVVIGELSPAKTYHFRAVSRDKAGNITKSGSYSVLTSRKRESFLQLIIGNLEETFSWVGNIGGLL